MGFIDISSNSTIDVQMRSSVLSLNINSSSVVVGNSEVRAAWWVMCLVGLVISVTILANFLVMLCFLIEPRLRTPFNFFILNSAVTDFLEGVLDMPQLAAGYTYYDYWPFSEARCTFWMYVDYTFPTVSVWTVVIMSVDRMWCVTWPVSYRRLNSYTKCACGVAFTWIITNVLNFSGFVYSRTYFAANQSVARSCVWDVEGMPQWASSFWGYTVGNCWVAMSIGVVCYCITVVQICKTGKAVGPFSAARKRRDNQALLALTLMIIAMLVLWMPWYVHVYRSIILGLPESDVFVNTAYWMSISLSALNPFLFHAANSNMRLALKKLFRTISHQSIATEQSPTRAATYRARLHVNN